jgi:nifR3 family TIM-barrel protein
MMAEAAKIVEAQGADILDINFGCSVKKIIKTGSGVALMKRPDLCEAVLKNVRNAVRLPLTIKIRTGWDESGEQALKLAQIAEACGIDGIAVHPRTATQGFSGQADWSIIAAVKRLVSIPVIGNGDIFSAEDAIEMQAETGCDAVMIGRKAIGCPWIFSQVIAQMRGENIPSFSLEQRFAIIKRYLHSSVKYLGEYRACLMMRSRLSWFVKGLPNSSQFRKSITQISSESQALELIEEYYQKLIQEADRLG